MNQLQNNIRRNNEIKEFTGISSSYEVPENPFLMIDTKNLSITECVDLLYNNIFLDR